MARYVRFTSGSGQLQWGCVQGEAVVPMAEDPIRAQATAAQPIPAGPTLDWGSVGVLAPPVRPSKIVCVGRNYRAHAAELDNDVPEVPLLFLKPPSCLVGHGGDIVYPTGESELVHHEAELAVVMGRRARRVSAEDAGAFILGYSVFNDVTARDLQRRDGQFTRGKGFDTFGPLGPWVDTDFTPRDQAVTAWVNGAERQRGRLSQMIFGVAELVAFVSRVMTLEPYDVLATGTPAGVGPLAPGDLVEVEVEGLGRLSNHVVRWAGNRAEGPAPR